MIERKIWRTGILQMVSRILFQLIGCLCFIRCYMLKEDRPPFLQEDEECMSVRDDPLQRPALKLLTLAEDLNKTLIQDGWYMSGFNTS